MFHWICPECGREIMPTMKECPACDASAAAAPPPLPEAVSGAIEPAVPAQVLAAAVLPAPAVADVAVTAQMPIRVITLAAESVVSEIVPEPVEPPSIPVAAAAVVEQEKAQPERPAGETREISDPLRAAAEQLRSLQAQAHAQALANEAQARAEAKAKAESHPAVPVQADPVVSVPVEAEAIEPQAAEELLPPVEEALVTSPKEGTGPESGPIETAEADPVELEPAAVMPPAAALPVEAGPQPLGWAASAPETPVVQEPVGPSESMVADLAALASINEPGVAPEAPAEPEEVSPELQPLVPSASPMAGINRSTLTQPVTAGQMSLLVSPPSPAALLTAPQLDARVRVEDLAVREDSPQMPGLATLVDSPRPRPLAAKGRQVFVADPIAPVLMDQMATHPVELDPNLLQGGPRPPSFPRATLQGSTSAAISRTKPQTFKATVRSSESAPQFPLPGPSIPPQLESISQAGLTAAPIGKNGFQSKRGRGLAPGMGQPSSVKGWLVSLSVMTAMLAFGGAAIYWAIPSQTLASVRNPASKTEPVQAPVASAVVKPETETPAMPSNSLSRQIEVTGFRFVTPPNKKPEIHYLVVNHSQLALNDVTVYVTLRANNAKPGQPPLSRFSFRAPNVPPYESKEMSSTIEKVTQPITLPEWQEVKVEVAVGQ